MEYLIFWEWELFLTGLRENVDDSSGENFRRAPRAPP